MKSKFLLDIFFTVEVNGKNSCILFYPAFLVTGINNSKNTFIGYTQEERVKTILEKTITEDSISPICNVKFDED